MQISGLRPPRQKEEQMPKPKDKYAYYFQGMKGGQCDQGE